MERFDSLAGKLQALIPVWNTLIAPLLPDKPDPSINRVAKHFGVVARGVAIVAEVLDLPWECASPAPEGVSEAGWAGMLAVKEMLAIWLSARAGGAVTLEGQEILDRLKQAISEPQQWRIAYDDKLDRLHEERRKNDALGPALSEHQRGNWCETNRWQGSIHPRRGQRLAGSAQKGVAPPDAQAHASHEWALQGRPSPLQRRRRRQTCAAVQTASGTVWWHPGVALPHPRELFRSTRI